MIHNQSVIAIIPARSGSKGLPDKNIRIMHNQPLMHWAISCACHSKYIDRVILSTDSETYAEIGQKAGAEVPFLRPEELAGDRSSTIDVLLHTLQELDTPYDILVLLEPTSPLTRACDLDNALERFCAQSNAQAMVSVTPTDSHHPEYAAYTDSQGFLQDMSQGLMQHKPRQVLPDAFFPEGSFYISRTSALADKKSFYHRQTLTYPVQRWQAAEIDDLYDFKFIKLIFEEKMAALSEADWHNGQVAD